VVGAVAVGAVAYGVYKLAKEGKADKDSESDFDEDELSDEYFNDEDVEIGREFDSDLFSNLPETGSLGKDFFDLTSERDNGIDPFLYLDIHGNRLDDIKTSDKVWMTSFADTMHEESFKTVTGVSRSEAVLYILSNTTGDENTEDKLFALTNQELGSLYAKIWMHNNPILTGNKDEQDLFNHLCKGSSTESLDLLLTTLSEELELIDSELNSDLDEVEDNISDTLDSNYCFDICASVKDKDFDDSDVLFNDFDDEDDLDEDFDDEDGGNALDALFNASYDDEDDLDIDFDYEDDSDEIDANISDTAEDDLEDNLENDSEDNQLGIVE
jgi:hypothetical protein